MADKLQDTDQAEEEMRTEEILGWVEFGCWTAVVLIPILYYVNGPSVSTDQFVVRSALTVIAIIGGCLTTGSRLIRKRRGNTSTINRTDDEPTSD